MCGLSVGADMRKPTRVIPDSIGLNGFRARITCLTTPDVVSSKISGFDGKVYWVGLTCDTTYEIGAPGPFVHRRVLFKSTLPWPSSKITVSQPNPSGGIGSGEYVRATASSLSDAKVVGCLRRLFAQDTIRGVIQGPTTSLGVTILRDETTQLRGVEDGVRRQKKFWNSLKGEKVMQYDILPSGSFDFSLSNAPASQHVYLADIFSYGLQGLDSSLPDPNVHVDYDAKAAPVEGAGGQANRGSKRSRSDDSVMSGASDDSFNTSGLKAALADPTRENAKEGSVNISTVMKVYFKPA